MKELTTKVIDMCISKKWLGNISFRQAKRAMKRSCKQQSNFMKGKFMPCGGRKKRK